MHADLRMLNNFVDHADWQSAVSPIGNRRSSETSDALYRDSVYICVHPRFNLFALDFSLLQSSSFQAF